MWKRSKYKLGFLAIFFLCFSCEEILLEQDISSEVPEILAPQENSEVNSSTVLFQWAEVTGASSYLFQLATPSFDDAEQILVTTTVDEPSLSQELVPNNYEWRIKALNSGYSSAFTSAKFRVKNNEEFYSENVVLVSPPNNYITNNNDVTLEWQEVENAQIYRIQVLENSELFMEETTINNSLEMTFPEGNFTYKIRAENETQNTLYSSRNLLVDITSPNKAALLKPAKNSITSNPTVTFEWTRDPIVGSVEKDSLYVFKDHELQELEIKASVDNSYSVLLDREETYYWFLQAFDEAGNIGEKSEVFSFTIN